MNDDKVETVFPLPVYAVLIALALCWPSMVFAEPVFSTSGGGVTVTLHKEKCAMPQVTNLPLRATWEENGKTFEGCVGAIPPLRAFIFFFSDLTVTAIPMDAFQRVQGA